MSDESATRNEISIPYAKIITIDGKLHPSAKISLSTSIEKGLIQPRIIFETIHPDTVFELNLSGVGCNSLPCALDFASQVFPAFQIEPNTPDNVEAFLENALPPLATRALFENLATVEFRFRWKRSGRSIYAVGESFVSIKSQSRISRGELSVGMEDSLGIATCFSELPFC